MLGDLGCGEILPSLSQRMKLISAGDRYYFLPWIATLLQNIQFTQYPLLCNLLVTLSLVALEQLLLNNRMNPGQFKTK
jgi:hypothetical protein